VGQCPTLNLGAGLLTCATGCRIVKNQHKKKKKKEKKKKKKKKRNYSSEGSSLLVAWPGSLEGMVSWSAGRRV